MDGNAINSHDLVKIIKYSSEYIKGEPTNALRGKVGGGDISISEGDG